MSVRLAARRIARLVAVLAVLVVGCTGDSDDDDGRMATVAELRRTTATALTSTSTTSLGSRADEERVEAFRRFAREPSGETAREVRFADSVQLGLGPRVSRELTRTSLSDDSEWVLENPDYFRASSGPLAILDVAKSAANVLVLIGAHPHCASAPEAAPPEVHRLRRVSFQPILGPGSSCLEWWTVDLFLDDQGDVAAVTLDFWEP